MTVTRTITVRWTAVGFHRWPDAAEVLPERAYLADRHRHLFYFTAEVEVDHHDREIEFHDLLDYLQANGPSGELGSQSCEDLAHDVAYMIEGRHPGRRRRVSVFEDNECGATIEIQPEGSDQ